MHRYVPSYDNIALYATRIITSSTIRKSLMSWIVYIRKEQLGESNKQNDTESLPDLYFIICNTKFVCIYIENDSIKVQTFVINCTIDISMSVI